jgi:hypothetical protein
MTGWQIATLLVVALYLGLMFLGGSLVPEEDRHWLVFGYLLVLSSLGILRRLWDAILVRREILAFRSLSPSQREEFLSKLWPRGLRYEYEPRVDLDEGPEIDGAVERFPFPEAERRLHWWLFLAAMAMAGLPLASLFALPELRFVVQAALIAIAAGAAVPAAWLAGRLVLLSTKLEVTPFGVALLSPLGSRTVVPFGQALTLQNVAHRGYYLLSTPAGELQLRVHHARVASLRALQLIVERGGFEVASESPAGAP